VQMRNMDIRNAVLNNGVKFYQIAEKLGISDAALSKRLRNELPEEEKQKILNLINEIRSGR